MHTHWNAVYVNIDGIDLGQYIRLLQESLRIGIVLMIVEFQSIPDVVRVRPRRFGDARGYFSEVFSARGFCQQVADVEFVQDNEALSGAAGTLRGL
ncbi:dTDP-4-dehydrorhamnose 3,5-epimerase family protein, partial [Labrys sp. 22185]|uniref:dTDP-4-dehydrorhamnose 3,5-epimerase family protein n=1 Tax=Labrys sp. 22185 TaxID=3453888 RepID=UPI003F86A0E6